jgi:hypothetical protein
MLIWFKYIDGKRTLQEWMGMLNHQKFFIFQARAGQKRLFTMGRAALMLSIMELFVSCLILKSTRPHCLCDDADIGIKKYNRDSSVIECFG